MDVESPEICLIENKYSESSKSMIARSNTLTKLNINYHYQNPISFYVNTCIFPFSRGLRSLTVGS